MLEEKDCGRALGGGGGCVAEMHLKRCYCCRCAVDAPAAALCCPPRARTHQPGLGDVDVEDEEVEEHEDDVHHAPQHALQLADHRLGVAQRGRQVAALLVDRAHRLAQLPRAHAPAALEVQRGKRLAGLVGGKKVPQVCMGGVQGAGGVGAAKTSGAVVTRTEHAESRHASPT